MKRPFISFLTDFGTRDAFVGICKGVMVGIAPDAQIVDLTHEVRPFRVRDGAVWLRSALPSLPVGVHLAIVDPGVGTERRAIAMETRRGDFLVGPDNGLLSLAADALGGIVAAHELVSSEYRLASVSGTFHGRDIFSPAAAHLAMGVPVEALGPRIAREALVRIDVPVPVVRPGELTTIALYVDTFGSVETAARLPDLETAVGLLLAGDRLRLRLVAAGDRTHEVELSWARTFGEVGENEPLIYVNSYGYVGIAINRGSAAERFGLNDDDGISITRA